MKRHYENVYEFEINGSLYVEYKAIEAVLLEEAEVLLERERKDQNATYELNRRYTHRSMGKRRQAAKHWQKKLNLWYDGLLTQRELTGTPYKTYHWFINEFLFNKGYYVQERTEKHECRVLPTLDPHFQ